MNEFKLKIGNVDLGLRVLGDGSFQFKNTDVAIQEIENFKIRTNNKMNSYSSESNNGMNGPTLFFNDKLITLKEMQPNLYEPTSYKLFQEALKDTLLPNIGFDYRYNNKAHPSITRKNKKGKLAIIVPFFNYNINRRMMDNYKKFRDNLSHNDVFVIESTMDGNYAFPESANFMRILAKPENLMWQKERMINLALQQVPAEYTNIAWIDADLIFTDPNWVAELNDKLDHYAFVQLFDRAEWLDIDGNVGMKFRSPFSPSREDLRHHVGFAWAARREVLELCGGLFDYHVTGNGDCFIYHALTGVSDNDMGRLSSEIINALPGFNYSFYKYRKVMQLYTNSSVSCLSGTVQHLYHGSLAGRKYSGRQQILIKNDFDPMSDLRISSSGLFEWVDNGNTRNIKQMICEYFHNTSKE